jgi:hypothetical protein
LRTVMVENRLGYADSIYHNTVTFLQ